MIIISQKQNYFKLISSIISLTFIFSIFPCDLLASKIKAAELNSVGRTVEEIKKTSTYEEKKITLKIKKPIPDPKGRAKIDFEILVDASGSMRDSGSINKTKEVLKDFINSRNPNYDRISITTFRGPGYYASNDPGNYAEYITTIHQMNNNFATAIAAVDSMEFGGFTPLLDGLNTSKLNLDNSGSTADRKVLIILGDGHPNVGPERDHYYGGLYGDYYGKYPNNYPGYEAQKELDIINEKVNNGEIEFEEAELLSAPLEATLKAQQKLYPGATQRMLTEKFASQTQKDLKGTIYDYSKAEFYDLRYLVMQKITEIKNANYEVFSVFLNNEKPGVSGYKDFLDNTKEAESLFKEIAKDDNHYFYSENVDGLPTAFDEVKKTINTFDYFVNDTIEDGFELMPDTFEASQKGVIPKVDGKNITWDVSGVPYNELEVSYHIKREIPSGNLKVRYVDEATGNDIIDTILSTEPLNQAYTTEKKVLPGYEYLKVVGNETGKYVTGTTEVTYYYNKLATLGDKVWLDKNNDGIQDATELGIEGITVKLLKNDGTPVKDANDKEITTVTDANGNYSFKDVPKGDYKVQFVSNKDFYKFGEQNRGTDDKDSDADKVTGITDRVTLNAGDVNNSIDTAFTVKTGLTVEKTAYLGKYTAGKIGSKSVSGKNGEDITYIFTVKNTGDTYIKDLVVNDITLKVDKSKFTKVSGEESLAPGSTIVYYYETKINGDLTNKVEVSGTPSDKDGNPVLNIDKLNSSDTAEAKALGSMGDRVWNDLNKDGIQDANETGLKDVKVKLTDSKGNTVTTTTDANGSYIFDRLTPDKYTISIDTTTLPKNMEETFEKDNSKDNKIEVDLTAGQAIDDVDFSYKEKEGTLVVKYLEEGSNKELADTETTIKPIETDYNTAPKDITGYKLVKTNGVETGKYVEGTTTVTYYYKKLINIGDFIWNDLNGDGKQDLGETGIPGVVVDLKDETGKVVATTTTDATGHYNFNTTVGKYSVSVNILKSLENSSLSIFNFKTTNTVEGVKDLSADFKDFDFGYYAPGSIGDRVWNDLNKDGKQDYNEPGIKDVTINLLDKDKKVLKTVITDATGAYKFDDLAPGTYTISIDQNTLPKFLDQTFELDNILNGNVQVIVKSSDIKDDVDFGYKKQIGNLTVKYIDESGKEISPSETTTENVGTNYTTTKKDITDYEVVKVEGNENDIYTNGNITVTYIYKLKQGTLVVKHLEEGTNKELSPTETSTNNVDTSYSTKSKNFHEYELVKVEGQETGKYSNEVSEVVYYYKKKVEAKVPGKIDQVQNNKETAQVKTTTETKLPKTGDTIPYANYVIGLLFLALGVYTFKRK